MRLLFLAPRHPSPALRGDQRRVIDLLRVLREHADITLLSFAAPDAEPLPFDGVRVRTVEATPLGRMAGNAAQRSPRLPGQVRLFLDRSMARAVREELATCPDVVHVTLSRMGPYLPGPGPWHRHIDLVDSLALNMRTRADASRAPLRAAFGLEAALVARYEAALAARADSASLVAEADRLGGLGLEAVSVIPNGVDLAAFPYRAPAGREPVLLFFGNLGYFHAQEPAAHLARAVLPLVRREIPGARLRLVGARPSALVKSLGALEGVEVVGPVESMADALGKAAIAAVPAFSGSGMKNKVLEAYAAGTPVVTNRTGIEGIDGAIAAVDHRLGETPEELAAACIALLRDERARREQAESARRLVEERYSWERQGARLLALYGRG